MLELPNQSQQNIVADQMGHPVRFFHTHEDADGVVGLDRARGTVLEVGALGHAGEDGRHRVDPHLGVRLQELDNLQWGADWG